MSPDAPRRVLVTGSRRWTDATTIRTALASEWGRSAGFRRNAEMVAAEATVCLAFP